MDCTEVNVLLDLLMDGELSDAQLRDLEAHGRECPACAEAIRATKQMKALFAEMEPEIDVPLEAQAKWRGAVRAEMKQSKSRRLRRWIASVAAAAVVLVGIGVTANLRGPTQSLNETAPAEAAEIAVSGESAAPGETAPDEAPMEAVANGAFEVAYEAAGEVADYEAADSAVVEADGVDAEPEDALEEFETASGNLVCAATAQRAPSCELAIRTESVDTACERILDLVEEYEGAADVQALEDGSANVYVEIGSENADDFLSAVLPLDTSGQVPDLPDIQDEGTILVLLTVSN